MLLGVILFFDGALLALGNVRTPTSAYAYLCSYAPSFTISPPTCGTLHLHRHGDGTYHHSTARGFPCMLQIHAFASIFCFQTPSCNIDLVPIWADAHHWALEDVLFLRAKTEASGDDLFHWRDSAGVLQVALRRSDCRNLWVPEPLRVRLPYLLFDVAYCVSVTLQRVFTPHVP